MIQKKHIYSLAMNVVQQYIFVSDEKNRLIESGGFVSPQFQ